MITARKVFSNPAAPAPTDTNVLTRIGTGYGDTAFLQTDGTHLTIAARAGENHVLDADLNLVAQRRHDHDNGDSYGLNTYLPATTYLGGDSIVGGIAYVSGGWKSVLYKVNSSLAIYPTPQIQYSTSFGSNNMGVVLREYNSKVYVCYCQRNGRFILKRYDFNLVEEASFHGGTAEMRPFYDMVVKDSGVYVFYATTTYRLDIIRLDTDLNPLNRHWFSARYSRSEYYSVGFSRGTNIYLGTLTRNLTNGDYDVCVWKFPDDMSGYDLVSGNETSVQDLSLRCFGVVSFENGNIGWVGTRKDTDSQVRLYFVEFNDSLDVVSQFRDNNVADDVLGGVCAIGNNLYVANARNNDMYVLKFGDRNFPTATQPLCDAGYEFENTSLTFTKESNTLASTSYAANAQVHNLETTGMYDTVMNNPVVANCEF